MKIAYCGFDLFFDCLKAIHHENHEIMKIFTVDTDGVYEFSDQVTTFADENNIQWTKNRITAHDIQALHEQGCELLVSAGYHYKIPITTGTENSLKGINLHPALLPIGRGAWPMPLTILKKLDITGVTVHKLSENFDEGDILKNTQFHLSTNENLETLIQKYQEKGAKLIPEILSDFEYYWETATPQEKGEYWKEPQDSDRSFTASTSIDEIDLIIRAFWGCGSIFKLADKEILIKQGKCIQAKHMHRYGEIVNTPEHGECYTVNGGYLLILQ